MNRCRRDWNTSFFHINHSSIQQLLTFTGSPRSLTATLKKTEGYCGSCSWITQHLTPKKAMCCNHNTQYHSYCISPVFTMSQQTPAAWPLQAPRQHVLTPLSLPSPLILILISPLRTPNPASPPSAGTAPPCLPPDSTEDAWMAGNFGEKWRIWSDHRSS